MNDLIKYLKQMTEFFQPPMCPLERFVLDCGKDFLAKKRPKGVRKQENKQCFRNATHYSLETGLSYVEGFAIHNGLIPMMHAWCVTEAGEVIDLTWRWPEKSVYRGVVIPRGTLQIQLVKNKVYGVLDHGYGINLEVIEELRKEHSGAGS